MATFAAKLPLDSRDGAREGKARTSHQPGTAAAVNASLTRLAGTSHSSRHGQLREIALRGGPGRAGLWRAEALVSGRARAGRRALGRGPYREVRSMAL
jgi:hypothetical protein